MDLCVCVCVITGLTKYMEQPIYCLVDLVGTDFDK